MKSISVLIFLPALYFCKGQTTGNTDATIKQIKTGDRLLPAHSADTSGGLIYFSYDNGSTWQNTSKGLPQAATLGLGSVAVSGHSLALTTKEHGVYLFDSLKNSWVNISIDEKLNQNNPAAMFLYSNGIYVGTQLGGVFRSNDQGKTWTAVNDGLENLTIRRFAEIDNTLHAGTNGGLYSLNQSTNRWVPQIAASGLQVNGMTALGNEIYIATNRGAYKRNQQQKNWQLVFEGKALHNISSDDLTIYAMTYNELFSSSDKGLTWRSIQKGLPAELYSFQVVKKDNTVLVAQWDGVYRKEKNLSHEPWRPSGKGLPGEFSVTNMQIYKRCIVVGCGQRKLKAGMTTSK